MLYYETPYSVHQFVYKYTCKFSSCVKDMCLVDFCKNVTHIAKCYAGQYTV
jgi:hypothetical protein